MLAAVELDDKLLLQTDEITNERVDGMLTPEFMAVHLAASELMPKKSLGIGGVAAEMAGEMDHCLRL
jgi:hypothetical protein